MLWKFEMEMAYQYKQSSGLSRENLGWIETIITFNLPFKPCRSSEQLDAIPLIVRVRRQAGSLITHQLDPGSIQAVDGRRRTLMDCN